MPAIIGNRRPSQTWPLHGSHENCARPRRRVKYDEIGMLYSLCPPWIQLSDRSCEETLVSAPFFCVNLSFIATHRPTMQNPMEGFTMSMKPSLGQLLDRRSFFKSTSTAAAGISLATFFNS